MEHRIWSLVRTRWCSDPALPFGNDPPCEVRWRCGSGCPGEGGIPAEWTSVRCSPRCWQTQRSAYLVSSQAESGWVAQSTNGAWGTVSVGGACWAAKRKQHESKVANSGHSEGLLCGVLSGWPACAPPSGGSHPSCWCAALDSNASRVWRSPLCQILLYCVVCVPHGIHKCEDCSLGTCPVNTTGLGYHS